MYGQWREGEGARFLTVAGIKMSGEWLFRLPRVLFWGNLYMDDKTQCIFRCLLRERNVLFNDALNTFYLRLYGVRHMVKDHSDSEKGNPLPPHMLLLSINSKGSFICTIPQTG